jgi:hypothetical protein
VSLDPTVNVLLIDPFPNDLINGHHWRIQIRRDRNNMWTIYNGGMWLQADFTWYPDQSTALRFEEVDNAVAKAQAAVKELVAGETTWDDMIAKWGAL